MAQRAKRKTEQAGRQAAQDEAQVRAREERGVRVARRKAEDDSGMRAGEELRRAAEVVKSRAEEATKEAEASETLETAHAEGYRMLTLTWLPELLVEE